MMTSELTRGLLAAVSLAACACASAQQGSSLTVYGIADAYVESLRSGAGSVWRLESGGLAASRLGFRGKEDLGKGLSAVFTLEAGNLIDDGTMGGNAFFGRQAFVGLAHDRFGQFTLGRQYTSLWHLADEFSIFSSAPAGPSTALIGGFGGYEPVRGSADSGTDGGPARLNNALKWDSPSWRGWRLGLQSGLGEAVNDTGGNRVYDGYLRYTSGPFDLMVSYVDDKGGALTPQGRRSTWSIGGAWHWADWRFKAGYLQLDDRAGTQQDGQGWWLGADYRIGMHLLKIQYIENRPRYIDNARSQGLGLGYEYSLSKRTTLYTALSYFRNQDGAGLGRASFLIPADLSTPADNDLTQFVGGIRFIF